MSKSTKPTKKPGGALKPLGFAILIDSREQRPYRFVGHMTIKTGLRTGDYSIDGYEDLVSVERKSLDDYYGCLAASRKRFERELERLSLMPYPAIVVEATLTRLGRQFRYGNGKLSLIPPASATGSFIGWGWGKVLILPCQGRRQGENWTVKLLSYAWKHLEADRKAKEKVV